MPRSDAESGAGETKAGHDHQVEEIDGDRLAEDRLAYAGTSDG